MRKFTILFLIGVLHLLCCNTLFAQAEYTITKDPKDTTVKILTGTINKYLVQNDTAFSKWFVPNKDAYAPDTALLNSFEKAKKQQLQFVIFGGTWCEDTQFILPKFFKLQEMGGVSDNNITLFGVNRNKKALGHIADAFNIINVPSIIVMKDGKELGRIVEYGKTGKWDKELAEIINQH